MAACAIQHVRDVAVVDDKARAPAWRNHLSCLEKRPSAATVVTVAACIIYLSHSPRREPTCARLVATPRIRTSARRRKIFDSATP